MKKVVSTLSLILGVVLVINGLASTTFAQGRSRRASAAGQQHTSQGQWYKWGSVEGWHPYEVPSSRAMSTFGSAPPESFSQWYEPGATTYTREQMVGFKLVEKEYPQDFVGQFPFDVNKPHQVWLGMNNKLKRFRNTSDNRFGPVPGYPRFTVWVDSNNLPQFYGGSEEGDILSCFNRLPVVWFWVPLAPCPDICESTKLEPVGTPFLRDGKWFQKVRDNCNKEWDIEIPCIGVDPYMTGNSEWRADKAGELTYYEEWTNDCVTWWAEGCPPDAMIMVFEYGVSGKLTKNKGRKVHEMVDNKTGQKLSEAEVRFLIDTITTEKLSKKKFNYLRIDRIVCGPGKGTLVVRYFHEGGKLKFFLIGLAVGLIAGTFIGAHFFAKACPPELFIPKEYVAPGPGAGSGNYLWKFFLRK